jgi:Ca2+-binding EF-hand superfamily protein
LIRERGRATDTLDDTVNATEVFDQDNDGKIPVEDFKSVMMNKGERMRENKARQAKGNQKEEENGDEERNRQIEPKM